jgi:hypothetical protein
MKRYAATRAPRQIIRQGAEDVARGQEDTDCRGQDKVLKSRKAARR